MTKKTLVLAATLIATATLSNAANAGGLRVGLGFGFPLGNFVAREHQSDTGRSYTKPGCNKPKSVARSTPRDYDPPVRHVKRSAPKPAPKVEVAEAPVRKVKRVAPKVEVAEAPAPLPRKIARVVKEVVEAPVIKTAKLEDNTVTNDAAPSIFVPETPPAAVESNLTGTQSTPAVARTAAVTVEPDPALQSVSEPVKVEKTAEVKPEVKSESETKTELPATVKRLCRRFSAAIAGLIDVPCE